MKILWCATVLAACGGGGGGSPSADAPATHDSPTTHDAPTASDAVIAHDAPAPDAAAHALAVSVVCPSSPAATVTSSDSNFSFSPPTTTINAGQIVKFQMSSTHNAESTDGGGIAVGLGSSGCYQFPSDGTWEFMCTIHGFSGSIVVSN